MPSLAIYRPVNSGCGLYTAYASKQIAQHTPEGLSPSDGGRFEFKCATLLNLIRKCVHSTPAGRL